MATAREIRVLCVGDVCGSAGVSIISRRLRTVIRAEGADFTIVNGENAALMGIQISQAEELFDAGADVITLGNHAFGRREIAGFLEENNRILRPCNLAPRLPGKGTGIFTIDRGGFVFRLGICVLLGRVHMDIVGENPFFTADRVIDAWQGEVDGALFEIHGEATSEKLALAHYLSGRASAVFGTHTHVQTADGKIIGTTGYITDLGMTGAEDSVIGVAPETSIEAFLTDGVTRKYQTAEGDGPLCGAVFTILPNGTCTAVKTVCAV